MRMLNRVVTTVAAAVIFLGATGASAQDYAREQRWADEIVPGLVVGDAVPIPASSGREFLGLYTATKSTGTAVVLVHGLGVHPDFGLIGALRSSLADAGYATLAIQMPVLEKDKVAEDYYPALFPDAVDRISRAADWLKAKGYTRLVLVSHSMGSWMSNVYLDRKATTPFQAWVCIGLTGGFQTRVLGINWPALSVNVPVLDIYGEKDFESTLGAAPRRARNIADIAGSRQVQVAGADHYFVGKEKELSQAIESFLRTLP